MNYLLITLRLILMICFIPSAFALELKLSDMNMSNAREVQSFLNRVQSIVPESIRSSLVKPIKIKFSNLDSKEKGMKGLVSNKFLQKRSSISTILLDHSVLEMIMSPDTKVSNNHETNGRYAKAIILHELMHIFDFQKNTLGQDLEFLNICNDKRENRKLAKGERKQCRKLRKKKYSLSDSPLFLNLAGWNREGLIFKKRKQHNHNFVRSADPYELTNPQEFLGVNFEYFMLDENYKCRRPNLYRYLAKALSYQPNSDTICKKNTEIQLTQEALKGKDARKVDLDPSRIYQIHYLFAGQGKAIMSRWGHAMVRLVICAPRRVEVSEECMKDVAHHIVLSFRANITDTSMSYIKGINGEYDSMMFLLPLDDVVKEYTQGEFRDVFSIPLELSKSQKEEMIDTILSQYWGYRGSYYFVTNNCATETIKLIRLGFQNSLSTQFLTVTTPSALFKKIKKLGLANGEKLENEKEAISNGYLFEGAHKKLEKIYEEFLSRELVSGYKNFEEFLDLSKANERRDILVQVEKIEDKEIRRRLIASLYKVEKFINERTQLNFMNKIADYILHAQREGNLEGEVEKYLEKYQTLQKNLLPENNYKVGYGIPLLSEKNNRVEELMANVGKEAMEVGASLIEWAQERFPVEINELSEISKNKNIILKSLRSNI